jgi:hypothetical protein
MQGSRDGQDSDAAIDLARMTFAPRDCTLVHKVAKYQRLKVNGCRYTKTAVKVLTF